MFGTAQVERTAHLEDRAVGVVVAIILDELRLFIGHKNRDERIIICLRALQRDPTQSRIELIIDMIAHDFARYLHGLSVVERLGTSKISDIGVVEK